MKAVLCFIGVLLALSVSASPPVVNPNFRVDQFGYPTQGVKIAFISNPQFGYNAGSGFTPGNNFELRDWQTDATVFTGAIQAWNNGETHDQSGDQVWWLDFSAYSTSGSYYLYDPSTDQGSYRFEISESVYAEVLEASVRMFYYQRCGTEKPATYAGAWADGASHLGAGQDLDCRSITAQNDPSTSKDLSGGWYDAGDYNKYVNFTYNTLHNLLFAYQENPEAWTDNYNLPESGNGIPDLLDEIRWELDWLFKMQLSDGSVLSKVSSPGFSGESPPSADPAQRFYGPAIASSTAVVASVFAHASIVFSETGIPELQQAASELRDRAELAWFWLAANPAFSYYDNAGFSTANPEMDEDTQAEVRIGAAAFLHLLTGEDQYKNYFANNYQSVRPYTWGFWYAFGGPIQDIMLYYTNTDSPASNVRQDVRDNFWQSATAGNQELLPAYQGQWDAYRAYLKESDHVWGSNQAKAIQGNLLWNLRQYELNPAADAEYQAAAGGYLHYFHGANPMGLVYLSNMSALGAEMSLNQIYHGWFYEGTTFDDATTGVGPAPGYLSGGCNIYYQPDPAYSGPALSPPMNQPAQKSYKDWNTSWPENSWEITEPAIYYQAAYIRLLSKFTEPESTINKVENSPVSMPISIYPNPSPDIFQVEVPAGSKIYQIRIFSAQGKELQVPVQRLGEHAWTIDLTNQAPGVYWLLDTSGLMQGKLVRL